MYFKAIRGATTVENNDATEIIEEAKKLLGEIVEKNNLQLENIISATFTTTRDLDAAYPAVGARQIGWTGVALMCMSEMYVPGSLEKCIRVIIHINAEEKNKEIKYVYLKGAKILRPDLEK